MLFAAAATCQLLLPLALHAFFSSLLLSSLHSQFTNDTDGCYCYDSVIICVAECGVCFQLIEDLIAKRFSTAAAVDRGRGRARTFGLSKKDPFVRLRDGKGLVNHDWQGWIGKFFYEVVSGNVFPTVIKS